MLDETRTKRPRCAALAPARRALLALAALVFAGGVAATEEAVSKEYQVKAAFLYNFAKYVEWPAGSSSAADSPLVIGAYCPDAFGALLDKIVAERTIGGRKIVVQTLKAGADARFVHLVYVCAENEVQWGPIGNAIRSSAVLTVADSEKPATRDAMIAFVLEGDKVRFSISMYQANQAGLKISDQLQKLAIAVRRTP